MNYISRFALFLALLSAVAYQSDICSASENAPLERLHHPRGRPLGSYQRAALRQLLEGRFDAVDSLKLIVLRAEFTDVTFEDRPEGHPPFDSLYYTNELRHLSEYFLAGSGGTFHLDWKIAPGIVGLSRPMRYYGEDGVWDMRMAEMLMEVVEAVDDDVDFSRYEAFAVIHAGPGSETDINGDSPDQISSGFIDPLEMAETLADTLGTPGIATNDRVNGDTFYVDHLMIWPQDASQDNSTFGALGIYAYQVGMRLGMLPLFDTTPSGFPNSQGIGSFGLMSYGLYNAAGFIPALPCAFHRYLMGWMHALDVAGGGVFRITDINSASSADTALLRIPVSSSEYFLVCNRVHDTNFNGRFDFTDLNGNGIPENEDTLLGAEFDFFLTATTNPWERIIDPDTGEERRFTYTGSGMMIWHVDEQVIVDALGAGGYPNDNAALKGVDLEEADGVQDLDRPGGTKSFGSYLDAFREGVNTVFDWQSLPPSLGNSGLGAGVAIRDISAADSIMTCTVDIEHNAALVRSELGGDVGGLSPIPLHLDGSAVQDLVLAADTGLVFVAWDACADDWDGRLDTLVTVPGAVWTDSPVFQDYTGDGVTEVFITAAGAVLYAFEGTGGPYAIDTGAFPESLKLRGDIATAPMTVESDGDAPPEILVLSSNEDSTFTYLIEHEGGMPGSGWKVVGSGVIESGLLAGRLVSHAARGRVRGSDGEMLDGFFVATAHQAGNVGLHFVALRAGTGQPSALEPVTSILSHSWGGGRLITPASGDVDGDGSDEMIIAIPARGLVYYQPYYGLNEVVLRGGRFSTAALEDINGDGVLETALRDEGFLYLLTGFGAPIGNWPIQLSEYTTMLESESPPAPPVITDIDGDAAMEIIFRAGRNLLAYEYSGAAAAGWPLRAEGNDSSSPAAAGGPADDLYMFVAGSHGIIGEVGTWSVGGATAISGVSRIALGFSSSDGRGWRFYRRDAGGTGRQDPSGESRDVESYVDDRSFIIYPNPVVADAFRVRIAVSAAARMHLEFMTIEGEEVAAYDTDHRWPDGALVPFEYEVSSDSFSSGIYICRLAIRGSGWSWSGYKKFAVVK